MQNHLIRLSMLAGLMVLLAPSTYVLAQPAATSQSTASSKPVVEHLTATVSAVKGLVQYRQSPDQPWQPCRVGMVLNEGAEFRNGPRSNVQLLLPPKQTVTLDRFGSMTLLEAVKSSGKFSTDVGLKRGRIRYNIKAPGIEHESTVSSPNGTLAVRDTSFAVDDERPFPPEAYRLSGTVEFSTAKRTISIGGGAAGNVKAVGDQNPSDTSLSQAVVDPSFAFARTPAESALVANVLSRGAVLTESNPKRIAVVSGGFPPTDQQLPHTLPGDLNFVARWDGNANLDLGLVSLASAETLYPATGLNTSKTGGIIPFDDIGGPNGGIELAFWKNQYPKGLYQLVLFDVSGVPVNYKLDVFEHGTQDTLFSSAVGTGGGSQTLTGTISSGQVVAGIVQVGGGTLLPSSTAVKKINSRSPSPVSKPAISAAHR